MEKSFQIDSYIGNARTIGISAHRRPDGDAIGSCLAMYQYLTKAYPELRIDVFLEEVPEVFHFMKGWDLVRTDFQTDVDQYDLFIALDTGKDRLLKAEDYFDHALHTINIDHHISNPGTGEINYVVPEASSTSELVYEAIRHDLIDLNMAQTIYAGIVTDTGVFKYSCTSPRTMQIGADLISYGFDFGALIDGVFYQKTFIQNRLLGQALLDSRLLFNDRVIVSEIDQETLKKFGAAPFDLEGIVSQLKLTTGVYVAIFQHELENGEWKVSLRSDEKVDVARISQAFDGGGHARAAGCTMKGSARENLDQILPLIQEQLKA